MSDDANGQSEAELMREQRLQRNLKILVTGMGLLIVLGLMGIGYRMTTLTPSAGGAATAVTTLATARGDIALELPKGAKVMSISISGNRLAVHHESPSGTGIAIIDLETGKRIADVKPREAVPGN
jgi:hypothetical protein